jgi:hypothetical protein
MASIINASSSGSGGIVQTADASGVLQLHGGASQTVANFTSTSTAVFVALANSGANTFIGNDSTSGSFVVQTPGSSFATKLKVDATGYVTNPYQVAVAAYNTVSQSVASGAGTVITLGGTRFNVGSAFNTSTNTFTAPVAGYYMCTGIVSWTGTFSSTRQFAMIYKNGAQTDGFGTQNARPSAIDLGVSTSGILYLAAGDTVQLAGFQESSGPQTVLGTGNSTWTNLTIRLLG